MDSFEKAGRSRLARCIIALAATLAALALTTASASAGQTHVRLGTFCEPTGIGTSPCEPSFATAYSLSVHQSSGDLIILDASAATVLRFKPNGEPDPFSALGSNSIDGIGPGADETPENGLAFAADFANEAQIAVDNSGGGTNGDIYVTQKNALGLHLVDIFAPTGEYLGQLTGVGTTLFGVESRPAGVAVGPGGDVFVSDFKENKIYKYVPSANPPVNTDGSIFSTGVSDPGQLAAGVGGSNTGTLFVSERFGQVLKLGSGGELQYQVQGGETSAVGVNPANGHLFVIGGGTIREYDASQSSGPTLVSNFGGSSSAIAAVGSSGHVYVAESNQVGVYSPLVPTPEPKTTTASNIGETSATLNGTVETFGEELTECFFEYVDEAEYEPKAANPYAAGETAPCAESFGEIGTGFAEVHADVGSLGNETAYHYRLIAGNANGRGEPPGEDVEFQTQSKPELLGEWAEGVTVHEATLKAKINPQSSPTRYRLEWGLTEAPYEHHTGEIEIGEEPSPHTVSLFLQNLAPGTEYHFRVFAENGIGTSTGTDHAFTTFGPIPPPPPGSCPANEQFRTAASAFLPDCRAYEMVSPVDKNGGDIVNTLAGSGDSGGYVQSAPDGNRIAYGAAFASFAGEPSSFIYNEYIAARRERGLSGEGWSSEGIHPPVSGQRANPEVFGGQREFMAFSPDLCNAWLVDNQTPAPTADGQLEYSNLYRRQDCGASPGALEALAPAPPALPSGTEKGYINNRSVQGVSADSSRTVFGAYAQLTSDAHTETALKNAQLYDRFGGANHLISVLPGGAADPSNATVGSGVNGNLDKAVSADGSHVYWTSGNGKLYLRTHPEQPQSAIVAGKCTEVAKACTLAVSGPCPALFATAASNGSAALYTEGKEVAPKECRGEDLYEYDSEEGASSLIAKNVLGVLGASDDLSRIYFVSTDELNGGGEGEEGGRPNLYLEEAGAFSFIGALVAGDVGEKEPGVGVNAYNLTGTAPYEHATRVTPNGAHIAFESRAPLTGYDNTDSASGKPAVEVFTYTAGGALSCVSCNPSGGRPEDVAELGLPYLAVFERLDVERTHVPAAAWIPTWEHPLHASNVISANGSRLFFNSNDALLPRDTNGAQDVYEWEAPGSGGCHAGDADYFAHNGGCLYLISSGESPSESEFWEASPDGADVFFTTASSLLPQDPGSVDLYDARIDGGFPQPTVKAECEGEACQSPPPPPAFGTPASATEPGEGNAAKKQACPRGKRRAGKGKQAHCKKKQACPRGKRRAGKGKQAHCKKKHSKQSKKASGKRRAKSNRRQAR